MDLVQEQRELEQLQTDRGVERYYTGIAAAEERGRVAEGTVATKIISKAVEDMLPAMRVVRRTCRARLVEAMTTGQRLGGYEQYIEQMDAESLAYITVKCALVASAHDYRAQRLSTLIGIRVNEETKWRDLREQESVAAKERGYNPPNRIAIMKRRVKEINPRSIKKWIKKIDDIKLDTWSKKTQFLVGATLLDVLVKTCPEFVQKDTVKITRLGRRMDEVRVRPTPMLAEAIKDGHEHQALGAPWLMPMVCPPADWKLGERGEVLQGGYLVIKQPIIKRVRYAHSGPTKVSDVAIEALNKIQRTAWRINTPVLKFAEEAMTKGIGDSPIPFETPYEGPGVLPAPVSATEWASMTKEERGAIKNKRAQAHSFNNRQEARRMAVDRILCAAGSRTGRERSIAVANAVRGRPIYFPYNMDWRRRVYPLAQDVHPQSEDFAKAMLTFAESKVLGEVGLQWLVFHLANCFGVDKVERQGQMDWYNDHMNEVYLVATDPFGAGLEFWKQADEPWQFLAACIEICAAWGWPGGPESYPSSLPVHIDGSCNGIQHLSAMGLDPVGAKAVNLMPGPRQDIYQIVADKVVRSMARDTGCAVPPKKAGGLFIGDPGREGPDEARHWWGRVNRKTVKRGVMTTPYGLTSIGMRQQLIDDRWLEDIEGDTMLNANYLRSLMTEAIDDTIVKGTEIMGWFQDCAEILADEDKGISWTTPSGDRLTQRYVNKKSTRVTTLLGRLMFEPNEDGTESIYARKQKHSIVPNIIHSFDAAHMMLSVVHSPDDFSFSVIHDSFGCHAADMEEFGHVIRKQFALIYKHDWFATMTADFENQGVVHVPEAPERGDFDIEQVLDAEFFFA